MGSPLGSLLPLVREEQEPGDAHDNNGGAQTPEQHVTHTVPFDALSCLIGRFYRRVALNWITHESPFTTALAAALSDNACPRLVFRHF